MVVTLSSCLIWQIINFILPSNEYVCVYTTLGSWPAIDLQKMPILVKKNRLFVWSSFWSWRVCKQAKLSHLKHRKPHAYIENSRDPKQVTVWCACWFGAIMGPFFFKNEQKEAATVNCVHYRAVLNEFLFTKIGEEDIGNVPHSQGYTRCFAPSFWRSLYQAQSWCRLATSELQFDTVGLLFVGCRQS